MNFNDKNNLPIPVARSFNHVLLKGQKTVKNVYLEHSGSFKSSPNGKWMKIKGKQYFKTDYPEFCWTGKTRFFNAVDKFYKDKGSLRVKLFSIIPIVNESGSHVDQAELLRWLGESVWFPTNFLPSKNLKWEVIDSSTSKLVYATEQLEIYYIVSFNEKGEIIQLDTERYKEKGKLEKWRGRVSDYKEFEGMKVPTHIEAIWLLESGNFKYVDFYVNTIKYEY